MAHGLWLMAYGSWLMAHGPITSRKRTLPPATQPASAALYRRRDREHPITLNEDSQSVSESPHTIDASKQMSLGANVAPCK
jgi:hypothetical protein